MIRVIAEIEVEISDDEYVEAETSLEQAVQNLIGHSGADVLRVLDTIWSKSA